MSVAGEAPASVAIRVDGGTRIGSGHVVRCLCLASAIARSGGEVTFLSREVPGHFGGLIEREGHPLVRLGAPAGDGADGRNHASSVLGVPWTRDSEETCAALEHLRPQWLVVDHYGLGAEWERSVRPSVGRMLVIDDLADRAHDCDALLDQNYFGGDTQTRYSELVPAHCRLFLGPRYALLQQEYAALRAAMVPRAASARRVLVFFGGTDATDETSKALRALARPELAHLAVDVVLGANHPDPAAVNALAAARAGTTVYSGLTTLAGLMFRADLAVGAGGTATSERLCMDLPSVVVTLAPNQEKPIANLAGEGAVVWAGRAGSVGESELAGAILRAIGARLKVPSMVDGHGAARVSAVMIPPPASKLRLRRARVGDVRLLFDWRNDTTARAMSFDETPITWDSHLRWFESKLADRNSRIFIGNADDLPVGQVRLEEIGGETVLSYVVDPDLRGLGFGTALVELAVRARTSGPQTAFRAHVKAHNEASRKVFRKLGWRETIAGSECVYRFGGGDQR